MEWIEIGTIVGVFLGAALGFCFSLVSLKLGFSHDWRKFHRANSHQTHMALAEASYSLLNAIDSAITLDCKDASALKMTEQEHACEYKRQRDQVFLHLEALWNLQGRMILDADEQVIEEYAAMRKELAGLRRIGRDHPDFIDQITATQKQLFAFMNRLRVQSGLRPLEHIAGAHSDRAAPEALY